MGVLRNFKVRSAWSTPPGLFADAPRETRTDIRMDNPFAQNEAPKTETVTTEVRFYRDLATAQTAVRSGEANQVLVVPADYRETGKLRRYARRRTCSVSTDERVLNRWLVRGLLVGKADSLTADRARAAAVDERSLRDQPAGQLRAPRRAQARCSTSSCPSCSSCCSAFAS